MNNTLYLVRHTRPAIAEGLCYGQSDIFLRKSFHNEAREVQKRLARCVFSSVYTSPLQRCVLLSKELNLKAQSDSRLMEMNFGKWENQPWDAIFASTEGKHWFENYLTAPCPGGESFIDLLARVESFLQDLGIDIAVNRNSENFLETGKGTYLDTGRGGYANTSKETDKDNNAAIDMPSNWQNGHEKNAAASSESSASKNGPYCLITHAGVIRAMLVILCAQNPRHVFDLTIPYGQVVTIANNTFSLGKP